MNPELRFRTDLYRGTAAYYDRYRPPYPEALFEDLRRRLQVSGAGRLLDLACGTGQIAFPLARHFREVVAVDQEGESVAFGQEKAERLGAGPITWTTGSAETVNLDGHYELITVGNAFQRLDRQVVARRLVSWLQAGGGVALIWADSPWRGDRAWQRAMEELFGEWMVRVGATDRVPAGWEAAMAAEPHEQVLRRAGLDYVGQFSFTAEQTWTVETLAGFAYSTSFLNRRVLGDRAAAFEADLAERLLPFEPSGIFTESARSAYELARKVT